MADVDIGAPGALVEAEQVFLDRGSTVAAAGSRRVLHRSNHLASW
jgi:hypothetical protein